MATYAIGDVQGCHDPLRRLLDALKFDPAADRLWFVGDLVNRGGQSLEVLRLVRSLDASAVVVLGNHDLSLLAIAEREEKDQRRVNPDLQRVLFAEDREPLLEWLRARPLMHLDTELDFAMVHAGLAPKWSIRIALKRAQEVEERLRGKARKRLFKQMYGNKPSAWTPSLDGMDRLRAIINVTTRLRFCDVKGRIAFDEKGPPGSQTPGLYPWYEVPGHAPREHRIVFGHWSALGLYRGLGVYGIDTGCVWGGPLTALELGPEPRVIQVPGLATAIPGHRD
jgi:bis(5'-nucleosyl)-tetraphosphatase (symmetrical)